VEINRYIKDLLLEHDCVVIPGLGGFIGSAMRAEVQTVTKTINPPGKRISFNGQLQRNDGLLIHHISLVEGISYDAAEEGVQQFVKACKRRLEQSGLIIFPEVGKLMADAEGTISFHPTPGRNLLQESFGLKPVHYRQIFDTVTQPAIETPESAPLQPVRASKSKTKNLLGTYGLSLAAMLVLAVFIAKDIYLQPIALENFGFFRPESFMGASSEKPKTIQANINADPLTAGTLEVSGTLETASIVPAEEEVVTPVVALIEPAVAPTPSKEVVKEASDIVVPHITEIQTADIDAGYYIVLGAYSSKRNANNFIKEHQTLSGLITIPSNNLFRVALPAGNVATAAYQLLEKQRQQENPAAWLIFNNK
jgi:hypothetical protein